MKNMFRKLIIITSLMVTAIPVRVIAEEPVQDPDSSETTTEVTEGEQTEQPDATVIEEKESEETAPPSEEEPEVTEEESEARQMMPAEGFVEKETTEYEDDDECEVCKVKAAEAEAEAMEHIDPNDSATFLNHVTNGIPVEGELDFTVYTDPNAMEIDNAQVEKGLYNIAGLETESGTLEEYFGRGEYESDEPSQAEIDTEDNRKDGTPVLDEEEPAEEADGGGEYSAPKARIKAFVNSLVTVEQAAADSAYLYVQPPYSFVSCGGIYGMSDGYHSAYYPMAWTFDYALSASGDPVFCLEPWKPMSGSYDDGVRITKDSKITVNSDASTVTLDGNKLNNLAWACRELYRRHPSPEAFYVGQLAIWNAVLAEDVDKGINYINAYNGGNGDSDLHTYVTALSNWGYGSPVYGANSLDGSTGLMKAATGFNAVDNAVWSGGSAGSWGGLPDLDWKPNGIGTYANELKNIYNERHNSHAAVTPTGKITEKDVTGSMMNAKDCGANTVNQGSATKFRIEVKAGQSTDDVILISIDNGLKIYDMADLDTVDEYGRYHAKPGAVPHKVNDPLHVNTDYFVTVPDEANKTVRFKYSQIADPNQKGGTIWGQSDSCTQDVITADGWIDDVFIGEFCFTTKPSHINFKKLDSETNQFIKGAILRLYKIENGREIQVGADEAVNGSITRTWDVAPGDYKLYEIDAPNGYFYSRPVEFKVMADHTITQTFTMYDEPFYYKVLKVDQKTKEPMAGVGMQLRTYGGGILEDWISELTPHSLDSKQMKAEGTYKIHETSTVPGYLIQRKEVVFTVPKYKDEIETLGIETTEDGAMLLRMENPEIQYSVRKLDAKTGDYVPGATMVLLDGSGDEIFRWTTTDGPTRIPSLKLKEGQTYSIREEAAPDGYYKMDKDKTFRVNVRNDEVDQMIFVDVYEYPISYMVTKKDKDTGNVIPGVTLALYAPDGTEMERWETALEDHVINSTLKNGTTYTVKELATVPGYYLDTKEVKFTVQDASGKSRDDLTVEFENTKIQMSVIKRDAVTKQPIPGITLTLLDGDTQEEIYDFITTDQAVMLDERYLVAGKSYIIREKQSVNGYYFTANDINFTVPATLAEARAQASNGFPIVLTMEDRPIKYQVLKKDAATGDYLEGVELALYKGSTMLDSWITDGTPHTIEPSLLTPLETYTVKETRTIDGYYFNDQPQVFTVGKTPDQTGTIKLTVENYPIEMKVRKVDEEGQPLTTVNGRGFEFEIYDANNSQDTPDDDRLIDAFTTKDTSYTTTKWYTVKASQLKAGRMYRIHEAYAPNGYMIADDAFITIPEVKGASTLEVVIEDEKIEMHLKKVDENGNTLTTYTTPDGKQHGFLLDVYDAEAYAEDPENTPVLYTIDTSSKEYVNNGYADISSKLAFGGTYLVKERDYPVGYYKAQDKVIVLDGSTDEVQMVDPKVKAKFRKEELDGSLVTTVNGDSFKFNIFDTNGTPDDPSDDKKIVTIDTKDCGADGYIDLSNYLQEGRTYRINEFHAPDGYELAEDKFFTMPTYYEPQS